MEGHSKWFQRSISRTGRPDSRSPAAVPPQSTTCRWILQCNRITLIISCWLWVYLWAFSLSLWSVNALFSLTRSIFNWPLTVTTEKSSTLINFGEDGRPPGPWWPQLYLMAKALTRLHEKSACSAPLPSLEWLCNTDTVSQICWKFGCMKEEVVAIQSLQKM